MNILIADDDLTFSRQLLSDLSSYFDNEFDDILFEVKATDFFDIKSEDIDVAFLDIDLKVYNGIEYGKYLRKLYPKVIIIYISRREDLVFNTFSTGVFQFIRKSKYHLDSESVFEQLKNYLKKKMYKRILTINGRVTSLDLNDIQYILSIGQDIIITMPKQNYTFKMSINAILIELDAPFLIQIQRNLVVNFSYLSEVKRAKVVTLDGTVYKVGRKYQDDLIKNYEEFLINDN